MIDYQGASNDHSWQMAHALAGPQIADAQIADEYLGQSSMKIKTRCLADLQTCGESVVLSRPSNGVFSGLPSAGSPVVNYRGRFRQVNATWSGAMAGSLVMAWMLVVGWLPSATAAGLQEAANRVPLVGNQKPLIEDTTVAQAQLVVLLNDPNRWRQAFELAEALSQREAALCWQMILDQWQKLQSDGEKIMMLSAVARTEYRFAHRVVHLGMTDASLRVQNRAIGYVRRMALFDPALDFSAYLQWYRQVHDDSRVQVVTTGARQLDLSIRNAIQRADLTEMNRLIEFVSRHQLVRSLESSAGSQFNWPDLILEVMAKVDQVLHERGADKNVVERADETIRYCGRILRDLKLSDDDLRQKILPLTFSGNPRVQYESVVLLSQAKAAWAFDRFSQLLTDQLQVSSEKVSYSTIARGLARIGDPRAIPLMIGVIDADNSRATIFGVGYFGLMPMTGVEHDESHDGNWWRGWWQQNRTRFSPDVQRMTIPKIDISITPNAKTTRAKQ